MTNQKCVSFTDELQMIMMRHDAAYTTLHLQVGKHWLLHAFDQPMMLQQNNWSSKSGLKQGTMEMKVKEYRTDFKALGVMFCDEGDHILGRWFPIYCCAFQHGRKFCNGMFSTYQLAQDFATAPLNVSYIPMGPMDPSTFLESVWDTI